MAFKVKLIFDRYMQKSPLNFLLFSQQLNICRKYIFPYQIFFKKFLKEILKTRLVFKKMAFNAE